MFEKHAVIGRFKDDVAQHLEVIESEIEKGNREEATLWLNELLIMKQHFGCRFLGPYTAA